MPVPFYSTGEGIAKSSTARCQAKMYISHSRHIQCLLATEWMDCTETSFLLPVGVFFGLLLDTPLVVLKASATLRAVSGAVAAR